MGFGPTMACGGRWQAGRCVFARGHCGPRGHGRLFHRVPHERLWSLRAWLVRAVAGAVLVPQMRRGMTLPFGFADGAWEAPARAWCVVGMWALRATWAPGALRRARPLTAVALACMLHGPPSRGRYLFVGAMAKSGGDVVLFCCVVGLGWGVALLLASTAGDDASCGRRGALLLEWEGCFWRALWCTPRPPLGLRGRPRGWFTWGTPVVVADSLVRGRWDLPILAKNRRLRGREAPTGCGVRRGRLAAAPVWVRTHPSCRTLNRQSAVIPPSRHLVGLQFASGEMWYGATNPTQRLPI